MGFPNAYKAIGLHIDSRNTSALCFARPSDNEPFNARILAQPSGSRMAPANWGIVGSFFKFLAARLLTLVIAAYVGDIFCCEPPATSTSGFRAFKALAELQGFPTSDKKGRPPTRDIYLLGAEVSLGGDAFQAPDRPERVAKLRGHIAQAIQTGWLSPEVARKLRGELGRYASLLEGKLGRGTMGQLVARQYYPRSPVLTHALRRNLLCWYSALGNIPPRFTSYILGTPVGAHTDAQGLGHIAAAFLDSRKNYGIDTPARVVRGMGTRLTERAPYSCRNVRCHLDGMLFAGMGERVRQNACPLLGQQGCGGSAR